MDPALPAAQALHSLLLSRALEEGVAVSSSLVLDAALAFDTVRALASTVRAMGVGGEGARDVGGHGRSRVNASCAREKPWDEGATFFNYLRLTRADGITGRMAFKVRQLSPKFHF